MTAETPRTERQLWLVVSVLIAVELVSSFESSMIFTALPAISRHYDSIEKVGWLITAFVLAQAATASVGGRIGDIFGRKRLLLAAVALCALGWAISAVSTSLEMIVFGRGVQGCSGVILPLCYGILREITPPPRLPFFIGCLAGGYAISAAIGYVAGGFLVDMGGWHLIFVANAGYALLLLAPMKFLLPDLAAAPRPARIDWGGLLFAPAIMLMLFGVTQGREKGWGSIEVWGFLAVGVAVLVLWCWHELNQDDPLIDVRLLARREVAIGNALVATMATGSSQLALVLMMILQQPVSTGVGLGVAAGIAGLIKLPSNIAGGVASAFSGYIFGRWGARPTVLLGSAICGVGYAGMAMFHDTITHVVAGTITAVIGATIVLAAAPALVLMGTPENRSSEATGVSAVVRGICMALGVQVVSALLAAAPSSLPDAADHPTEAAYLLAFGFMGGSAVLAVVLGCLVRGRGTMRSGRV